MRARPKKATRSPGLSGSGGSSFPSHLACLSRFFATNFLCAALVPTAFE